MNVYHVPEVGKIRCRRDQGLVHEMRVSSGEFVGIHSTRTMGPLGAEANVGNIMAFGKVTVSSEPVVSVIW